MIGYAVQKVGNMYTFVYPENNQKVYGENFNNFETESDAVKYWEDKRGGWDKMPQGLREPAFMNNATGEIVVVRKSNQRTGYGAE